MTYFLIDYHHVDTVFYQRYELDDEIEIEIEIENLRCHCLCEYEIANRKEEEVHLNEFLNICLVYGRNATCVSKCLDLVFPSSLSSLSSPSYVCVFSSPSFSRFSCCSQIRHRLVEMIISHSFPPQPFLTKFGYFTRAAHTRYSNGGKRGSQFIT
jgi:hypothetical protein